MTNEIELMIEYYENHLNNHNYTPEQITNSLWENEESLGEYEGDIDSYFDSILPQVEELMSKRNLKEDLFGIFDSISRSHPEDSYRTIWEIYCHKFDVDYNTEDFDAEMFDEWVNEKKILVGCN